MNYNINDGKYTVNPSNMVCTNKIEYEVSGGKLRNVKFHGGCPGNLKAICKLLEGKDVNETIELLSGLTCGLKPTSCTDQLAQSLIKNAG